MKAILTPAAGAALAMVMLGGPAAALSHASPQSDHTVTRDILQTTPVDAPVPQNAVTGVVTFPPRAITCITASRVVTSSVAAWRSPSMVNRDGCSTRVRPS